MEVSIETLKQLFSEAFDLGYNNSNEFKADLIEELLAKVQAKPAVSEESYRVYKCAELKQMPEGTIFQHSTRGRCWIVVRPDGTKAMQFQKAAPGGDNKGMCIIGILNDNEPWDRPMKKLHSEN